MNLISNIVENYPKTAFALTCVSAAFGYCVFKYPTHVEAIFKQVLWDHPSPFAYRKDIGFLLFNKMKYEPTIGRIHRSLDENIFVVTGASSGIGLETLKTIEGFYAKFRGKEKSAGSVIAAVRNIEKMRDVHKVRNDKTGIVEIFKLDLCDLQSVKDCAEEIEKHATYYKKKVILINNAGSGGWLNKQTKDGYEMTFQANYLGHYLLTRLLIKKNVLSRVLHVTSAMHFHGHVHEIMDQTFGPFGKVPTYQQNSETNDTRSYEDSKLMQNLMSNKLARGNLCISNCVHPGMVATNVFKNFPEAEEWIHKHNDPTSNFRIVLSPQEAALGVVWAVFEFDNGNASGNYISHMQTMSESYKCKDVKLQDWLWEASEKCCGSYL